MDAEEKERSSGLRGFETNVNDGTSDQLATVGYKYGGEEPSWIKKESRADGDAEETEPAWAYLQDER